MFLSILNNMHSNLQFTCEIGLRKLEFMDTQISLSSNNDLSLITSVHWKPTDTKTIINFHAVCPLIWKSGLKNVLSKEHLLFVTTGLHFMKKFQS